MRHGWLRRPALTPPTGVAGAWRARMMPAFRQFANVLHASATSDRDPLLARLEAALLTANEPIAPRRLAMLADLPDAGEARRWITRLNALLAADGSAFAVQESAGGYILLTDPALAHDVEMAGLSRDDPPLAPPVMETLTIIAYRQPIGRADIEAIRGQPSGDPLRQLMDRGLIRFDGRDDSLGRPYLYGTTKRFLQMFGLRHLHELPERGGAP